MFKYLKQLFHDVVTQSQQFVAVAENPEREIVRHEENRIPSQLAENAGPDSRLTDLSVIADRLDCSSGSNRANRTESADSPLRAKETRSENSSPIGNSRRSATRRSATETCDSRRLGEKKITTYRTKNDEAKIRRPDDFCQCDSCQIVTEIGECGVCLEPMQTRGVRSCPLCANVVCAECAARLKRCAFCRISLPMLRNRAIERLIGKLSLPCRNARNGCRKLLKSETRLRHEASCDYSTITCPMLNGSCKWQGSPGEVLGHLKEVHDITAFPSHEIFVEVSNLWPDKCGKCMANVGERTVYISCYSQLFAVNLTRHRKKWYLTFFQLAYVGPATEKSASSKYGVRVKVKAVGRRSFRELLPFDKFDGDTPRIEIGSRVAGTVNIEISIREIDDPKRM